MPLAYNTAADDTLLGDESAVKEVHRDTGIVPMLAQPDADILDYEGTRLHQEHVNELQEYLVLVENPQDVNEYTAPKLLAQLSYGFRKAGEYLGLARYSYKSARNARKRAEAIAAIDNIRDYVAKRKSEGVDIKITEPVRDHYINIDPDVIKASAMEALFEAKMEQLNTIKMEFLMAISTTKAIAYGHKDSDMLSGASVAVNEKE